MSEWKLPTVGKEATPNGDIYILEISAEVAAVLHALIGATANSHPGEHETYELYKALDGMLARPTDLQVNSGRPIRIVKTRP